MATYLGFPFDPELFNYNWANAKDPTLTAMFESGAVAPNAELARLIANGSDFYTLPFYKIIGGTPENYDGATDITLTDPAGGAQNGIVFGRAHGWKEKDFIVDYNSGADPMQQIVSQVSKYWQKQRQSIMLKILNAVFGVTGSGEFADWANHTTDLSSASTTVADANKMGATTIGDAIQKAVGDNQDAFQLVFMHSKVEHGWPETAGLPQVHGRKRRGASLAYRHGERHDRSRGRWLSHHRSGHFQGSDLYHLRSRSGRYPVRSRPREGSFRADP